MAFIKSQFSLGNGRLKEVDAFQYDSATSALSASVLLKMGAAGFRLDSNTFDAVALGVASAYVGLNDTLPTKGYVDEAIAGVTPGIPGDATYADFTVAASAGFANGKLVALGTTELVFADAGDVKNSNVIGVVIDRPTGTSVRVQLDGEVVVGDLVGKAKGDLIWVGAAGGISTYEALSANQYAVQAGIVSDVAADKIVLQPRIFGQVSA